MKSPAQFWLRISFINLLIISILGVVLRYKIAFPLHFIDQKKLLHGHSHFAFSGWITQTIMVLLFYTLSKYLHENLFTRYKLFLWVNLITAYGMLIAFPIQGYGFVSISFSTLSVLNGFVFTIYFWKDLNRTKLKLPSFLWYKAALIFNVISSVGAFSLAYLMATKNANQTSYLLSVYGYLHFQYNGWFFFACMGLFISKIEDIKGYAKQINLVFWLFSLACIPAYLLSALWLKLPQALYVVVVLAAFSQLVGSIILVKSTVGKDIYNIISFSKNAIVIMALSAIALSIKIALQTISIIPSLSQISFGFRPIVIGYLHLMLLGVISLFLIGFVLGNKLIAINKYFTIGVFVFVVGIIVNEFLLLWQGAKSISYIGVENMNVYLFVAAIVMFSGLLLLNYGIIRKNK